MYNFTKKVLPKHTIEYVITIPKESVANKYDETINLIAQETEIAGFRKGKAPLDIAKKKIKKDTVYEKILQKMLPEIYQELIKKESLKPIISPKIELIHAKEGEDWQIRITIAEKPTVNLDQYKEHVKKVLAEHKKEDIWVPGKTKDPTEKTPQEKEEQKNKMTQSALNTLLKSTTVDISHLLIESELEKRLTQLVDDVRKIGLSTDAYLKSKNETIESIKMKFTKEIEDMYALEFILGEIAEQEHITIENKDLEEFFSHIKDEKAREEAKKNAYFYATILRRQKTLDYLLSL